MKTQGKVPVAKSDFAIVSDKLANGIDRLQNLQKTGQLSDEQKAAVESAMSKISMIQQAAIECQKADSLSLPGARRKAIGETILNFDLDNVEFDQERAAFGLFDRFENDRAAHIDRDLEVNNLISGIQGYEDVEAQYQGMSSPF